MAKRNGFELVHGPLIPISSAVRHSVNRDGQTGVTVMNSTSDRQAVINKAGSEYDSDPLARKIVSNRAAWVNGELREAGLPPLTDSELEAESVRKVVNGSARASIIANASREFDANPDLQRVVTSRRSWVDGELVAAGFERTNSIESKSL